MSTNGQREILTEEMREQLNRRETIAHDDPTSLSTRAGWGSAHMPPFETGESGESGEDDQVDHPSHYTSHPSGVECIAITEHMNFNVGAAMGYLWRHELKGNPIQDLRKAEWHIRREIQRLSKTEGEA